MSKRPRNKVYVVESGLEREGGSVWAIYSSPESAIVQAHFIAREGSEASIKTLKDDPRNFVSAEEIDRWLVKEEPEDGFVLFLVWGCYYVHVREMELLP